MFDAPKSSKDPYIMLTITPEDLKDVMAEEFHSAGINLPDQKRIDAIFDAYKKDLSEYLMNMASAYLRSLAIDERYGDL